MSDYIKREWAIKIIAEQDMFETQMEFPYASDDFDDYLEEARKLLSGIPSADVVEVVRCKDCWKRPFDNCWFNEYVGLKPDDDFYCADGERRSDE